jgi:hypothetical protein
MCQTCETLPPHSSKETIDAFLAALVSIINLNTGQSLQVEALGHLFKFIKNGKLLKRLMRYRRASLQMIQAFQVDHPQTELGSYYFEF